MGDRRAGQGAIGKQRTRPTAWDRRDTSAVSRFIRFHPLILRGQSQMKLTVLGGSGIATPELITMLARAQERPALDVVLHGRTADKLQIVGGVCARLAQEAVAPLAVSFTTDLDSALEGADFVLNQIRVGGYAARAFDEMFPRELGLPGEETVGPGGFSLTARTIPVVLDDCRAKFGIIWILLIAVLIHGFLSGIDENPFTRQFKIVGREPILGCGRLVEKFDAPFFVRTVFLARLFLPSGIFFIVAHLFWRQIVQFEFHLLPSFILLGRNGIWQRGHVNIFAEEFAQRGSFARIPISLRSRSFTVRHPAASGRPLSPRRRSKSVPGSAEREITTPVV